MRPFASVSGMRCTRCTPDSYLSMPYAPAPSIRHSASLSPPPSIMDCESISVFQPFASAKRKYMRMSSAAKSAASSPPAPARISMITLLSSSGSLGTRNARMRSSNSGIFARASLASSSAISLSSPSSEGSSASLILRASASYCVSISVSGCSSLMRLPIRASSLGLFNTSSDAYDAWRSLNSFAKRRSLSITYSWYTKVLLYGNLHRLGIFEDRARGKGCLGLRL